MSTIDASLTAGASGASSADDVTAQRPIMVYSCNRLGRVANLAQLLVRRLVLAPRVAADPNRVSAAGCGGRQAANEGANCRPARPPTAGFFTNRSTTPP